MRVEHLHLFVHRAGKLRPAGTKCLGQDGDSSLHCASELLELQVEYQAIGRLMEQLADGPVDRDSAGRDQLAFRMVLAGCVK